MTTVVTFKRDKETKNKIRFSNDPSLPISGSFYVSKELAGTTSEIKLSVTLADIPATPAVA